jgi:anaphase-promoting complex subunit 3
MAPSTPHIATQLRHLIYYHLDNNLLKNALFLAQRLVAYESRSAEAAFLLAYCQFQSGYVKAANDTSRPFGIRGSHLGCAYVYAQACLDLGRYVEGLTALEKSKVLWQGRNMWNQHSDSRRQHLPDAAAVLCLRGKLWKAHKNIEKAVDSWANALKLNPFMWDAFEGLCEAGARISVPNIYKMSPEMENAAKIAHTQSLRSEAQQHPPPDKSSSTSLPLQSQATNLNQNTADPFTSNSKVSGHGSTALWEKLNGSKVSVNTLASSIDEETVATPSTVPDTDDVFQGGAVNGIYEPPPPPSRKPRSVVEAGSDIGSRLKNSTTRSRARAKGPSEEAPILPDPAPTAAPSKRTISGHVANSSSAHLSTAEGTRRSNRLLNTSRPPSASGTTGSKLSSFTNSLGLREGRDIKKPRAPAVKGRIATTSTVGRVVSGNRTRTGSSDALDADSREKKDIPPVPQLANNKMRNEPPPVNRQLEAVEHLLDLHARMGIAELALANFDCQLAIQYYNGLPSAQRETPYVLAQIGKAYYEQAQYPESEKFFARVRQFAPSRLEDMEIYSTVLWHQKSDIELAYLAHELMEIDRLSPQAWVAIGNSFSLQREHEQALRCFKRATQLDPSFAYGFTLQGHEFVANEEFDKALEAYRSAIAADSRHYNAWYGLGKVYEKMGKWAVAEQHYRTAAKINPTNAVLVCCIGVALEKLKQPTKALAMYSRACALAPSSALSRFKKARCLMTLNRTREALAELEILRDVAPDEANVWFLMGRLYKSQKMKGEAVRAFTMALNLDPKVCCLHFTSNYVTASLTRILCRRRNTSRTRWRHSTTTRTTTRRAMMTRMRIWSSRQNASRSCPFTGLESGRAFGKS